MRQGAFAPNLTTPQRRSLSKWSARRRNNKSWATSFQRMLYHQTGMVTNFPQSLRGVDSQLGVPEVDLLPRIWRAVSQKEQSTLYLSILMKRQKSQTKTETNCLIRNV
jgi:hypothetical protein